MQRTSVRDNRTVAACSGGCSLDVWLAAEIDGHTSQRQPLLGGAFRLTTLMCRSSAKAAENRCFLSGELLICVEAPAHEFPYKRVPATEFV